MFTTQNYQAGAYLQYHFPVFGLLLMGYLLSGTFNKYLVVFAEKSGNASNVLPS
jgi:hypothetical protein